MQKIEWKYFTKLSYFAFTIFLKQVIALFFLERKQENEINRSKYTLIKLLVSVKA